MDKLLDVDPASVIYAGATHAPSRAVVMGGRLLVFAKVAGKPRKVLDARALELTGRAGDWTVATPDGDATIGRAHGCGCSSPFRSIVPAQHLEASYA